MKQTRCRMEQLVRIRVVLCRLWVRFMFFLLFHGLRACLWRDSVVQEELESWPQGAVVRIDASKRGPCLILRKENDTLLRLSSCEGENLSIQFKSLFGAFRVTSFRQGIAQAFACNQMTMCGEVRFGMSFVRCMEQVELQLLPRILAKHLLTRRCLDCSEHWMIYKALMYSILAGKTGRNKG